MPIQPLSVDDLVKICRLDVLPFTTSAELPDLPDAIGQARALEALAVGIGIRQPGFNLFAFGPAATGMHEVVHRSLERHAASAAVPSDWIYVHDFGQAQRPQALRLPAGRAVVLRSQMAALVEDLRAALPAAFETDEYRARSGVIEDEVKERHQHAIEEIEKHARERGIALLRTPMGIGFAPLKGTDVMSPDEFAKLPATERDRLTHAVEALQQELQAVMAQLGQWQCTSRARATRTWSGVWSTFRRWARCSPTSPSSREVRCIERTAATRGATQDALDRRPIDRWSYPGSVER